MTNLVINNLYAGFRVTRIAAINELQVTAYELQHEVSGAKLLFLATEDDNKVFTIGFRTPSRDDTGVAHITEHSVLCGSRKYPLKEPFVELVKGSLNTFLNAMTYTDKTVYPVASRNDKDFQNLMDVYLDAVFYPLIAQNKYTLKQEGWHYEVDAQTNALSYNGVVYNEMKGVYSSADAIEEHLCCEALFPDSPYRFESGGYPSSIPTLTQEMFVEFHQKYYAPENSYIYLYGNMDIEATLQYLDKEYLQYFPASGKLKIEIQEQAPFEFTKEVNGTYPLSSGESTEAKTYLSLNIVTGNSKDIKTSAALKLLESVLLEGNDSPLRLALIEAGVGTDISGSFASSQLQPVFSIHASGSDKSKKEKFVQTIYHTLQDISRKGLDKQLLEASLNAMEFKLREADFGVYPKGLIYGLSVYETWLYGVDPIDALQLDELLKWLRSKLSTRYFEGLIENYLLDNSHKALIVLEPEPGLEEKNQAQEQEKLLELGSKVTAEEIQNYALEADKLHELQAAADSTEALATIPVLNRNDIRKDNESIPTEILSQGSRSTIYVPQFTNKIAYLNWYYDMSGVSGSDLPYMFLFSDVLGKMNTRDFTYQDLSTFTNMYTGGISFQIVTYMLQDDVNKYSIRFNVGGKVLEEKLDKLFKIMENVALTTDFTNKQRLREIIVETKTDWDNQFFARGLTVASSRLASYFAPASRIAEQDQLSYYQFLQKLTSNLETELPKVITKLQELQKVFFHKGKQLFAYSCSEEFRGQLCRQQEEFTAKLSDSPYAGKPVVPLAAPSTNEGITTAGKVQYVTAGGNFKDHGYQYTGAMKVLETILRYGYLWTKIRVQGGAYGANAQFDRAGVTLFTSYRDPKLVETLQAYQTLPVYLQQFEASEREMTKYVIGTISGIDIPLTNAMRLSKAALMEIKGLEESALQKSREEILNVTADDIRALAPVVEAIINDNYLCVVGGAASIENNKQLFKSVVKS